MGQGRWGDSPGTIGGRVTVRLSVEGVEEWLLGEGGAWDSVGAQILEV